MVLKIDNLQEFKVSVALSHLSGEHAGMVAVDTL